MKYQLVFSPDLGVNEDVLKEFAEKWNSDESCKNLAKAEIQEIPSNTYAISPNDLMIVLTDPAVITGITTGVASNVISDMIRIFFKRQRHISVDVESRCLELPDKDELLIIRKALSRKENEND